MKIILISIGSRGDMEPFIAIGGLLKEKGHQVICAFPEQFKNLAEESELEFASLGTKFIEMLESDTGKAALGGSGSGLKKLYAFIKLAINQTEINKELVHKQYEIIQNFNPDRIVYNGKVIYPIIWGLKNKGKNILISAVPYIHYVKGHAHIAFNKNLGSFLNKLSFSLVDFGMISTIKITAKWLKLKQKIKRNAIKKALSNNKTIYTISPTLFKRPDYWYKNIKILGYHQKNNKKNWQADKNLLDFIEKHQKILFITFGSMTNPYPEEKTKLIIEILERNNIPAIINTASGGLCLIPEYNSNLIHFVSDIPYDWIFPKVHSVIHHGGSGTTHLALKYSCSSMIIPHIIDQFAWNKLISDLKVGPLGIKISKINSKNLEPKILELFNSEFFNENAKKLSIQMNDEIFDEEIYNAIIK